MLADLCGKWEPAAVKRCLVEEVWGANIGYPGLTINTNGDQVHGHVLHSGELGTMWGRRDEIEGEEHERVATTVTLQSRECVCALRGMYYAARSA